MKLHENEITFGRTIEIVSDYFDLNPAIIEKDYYVTHFLSEANKVIPGLLFKGGTSLSKCYKLIDRFSEDIDLTLDIEHFTQGKRRAANKNVAKICNSECFRLLNEDKILSRRDYNCFNVEYKSSYDSSVIKSGLKIEMTFIQKSFPENLLNTSTTIYDYLERTNNISFAKKYELMPFALKVQSLERTFVDKVFAICDYRLSNKIERNSRHIYDLSKLLNKIKIDSSLKELALIVREERKTNKTCLSARNGIDINDILIDIADTDFFKDDYLKNTQKLLNKPFPYEDAKNNIKTISKLNIF